MSLDYIDIWTVPLDCIDLWTVPLDCIDLWAVSSDYIDLRTGSKLIPTVTTHHYRSKIGSSFVLFYSLIIIVKLTSVCTTSGWSE